VRLLHLRLQIDRVGQARVEQLDSKPAEKAQAR